MKTDRRSFLGTGAKLALVGSVTGISMLAGCGKDESDEGQEVSPPEDLMQEHGILNRILLIYDTCGFHLVNNEPFHLDALASSATIIRTFVEDYHEKQEENYLFPRFQKANQLTGLVNTLLQQHAAGRRLTDEIMQLAKSQNTSEPEKQRLIQLLSQFNSMYRPHEAREDTVLFPAFRKIVSKHEYGALGEEFEKNEQKLFGKDGFETMVERVAEIEKALGIFDLDQFTPKG